jgi:hypothetical protein
MMLEAAGVHQDDLHSCRRSWPISNSYYFEPRKRCRRCADEGGVGDAAYILLGVETTARLCVIVGNNKRIIKLAVAILESTAFGNVSFQVSSLHWHEHLRSLDKGISAKVANVKFDYYS